MHELPLISTMAAAFTAAWVLGILTQKLRLSPIVGYLLAGVLIGPHTPGFVADVQLSHQLAEIGVILLMFGVGLHFHLDDLLAVRGIAIPGAIVQIVMATLLALAVAGAFGLPFEHGLVLGVAMSVASTVVLVRVLADSRMLDSVHGQVAVGWLIVEDIFTVIVLVIIPVFGATQATGKPPSTAILAGTILMALFKLALMAGLILWAGARIIPWVMVRVARLRSRELFTLTVLVTAIAIAAGSAQLFGASMALGAFLAGMVVGQSPISKQAAADALPLRHAFSVLFFTSVGMVFDPLIVVREPWLTLACLLVVLVGKPLAAMAIVAIIGYPARTALTVAIGLAQIGEFSFILSETAQTHGLLDDVGRHVLVACALISITVNPLAFLSLNRVESVLKRTRWVWRLINRRADRRVQAYNQRVNVTLARSTSPLAVVLGYGPVGRTVDELLRSHGFETLVVDLNMDTIQNLTRQGRLGIYGDAYNIEVVAQSLPRATHLVIAIPHAANREALIASAKLINPTIKVFVRARYLAEREELRQVGADYVCYEEAEAAAALARGVLQDQGVPEDTIRRVTLRIRQQYGVVRQS